MASQFKSMIDGLRASQGVVTFSSSGRILECNDYYAATLGANTQDLIGRNHSDFVYASDKLLPHVVTHWENLRKGIPQMGEFRRRCINGSEAWIVANYVPIPSLDGTIENIIKFSLDVTEQHRSNTLLRNMLPPSIAQQLKDNVLVGKHSEHIAESFEEASILFADIVGFTAMSEKMSAVEVVSYLNKIFSQFDQMLEDLGGIEKIKTIGDAYMVAVGIPIARKDHAEIVCTFALKMLELLTQFNETLGPNDPKFGLRIGINCGTVVAGVIGTSKFVYDVWGGSCNLASRMESTGQKDRIQISSNIYTHIKDLPQFRCVYRGKVHCKGIGKVETWFVEDSSRPSVLEQ